MNGWAGDRMKDILEEITRLRLARHWSEYQLSRASGLAQSTISTWYAKHQTPTIQSLEKICGGFGITLSQFFAEGPDLMALTSEQRELLDEWSVLTPQKKRLVRDLIQSLGAGSEPNGD